MEAPNCNLGEFGDNIDVTFEVVGSGDEIAHVVVFAEVEEQREHEKREHVSPTRKSSCSVCKKPRDVRALLCVFPSSHNHEGYAQFC